MDTLIENKKALRKIKTVSRAMEMAAEGGLNGLSGPKMIQFVRDVQLYGCYEACLYVYNEGMKELAVKIAQAAMKKEDENDTEY